MRICSIGECMIEFSNTEKDSFKIWYGKDEKSVSAAERNLTIERILPKGLAKYFFFQGESLETMTDSGTDVGAAISNIQGIDDAKDVLEQLKKTISCLNRSLAKKLSSMRTQGISKLK